MFGNNRDEVCQRWDVLADEDHTHHLTAQEYFYNKNKWWFSFIKSGFDNVPLRNVLISSKRCLLWNVYTKNLENHSCPLVLTRTRSGSWHRVLPLHGGNGKTLGSLLIFRKSRKRQAKSWERTGRPVIDSILAKLSEDGLQEFEFLLQLDCLQLTAVSCNRLEV